MKRFIVLVLGIFLILGAGIEANAAEIYITSEEAKVTYPNIRFTGEMPRVSGLVDESFQDEVNARIAEVYYDFEQAAISANAFRLDFDFEHMADGDSNFILIYATIAAAHELQQISVISFDSSEGRFLTVKDFLGPNAVSLAEQYIAAYMRQSPGLFNSEFAGLSPDYSFVVADGRVEFLFNQGEIAPARFGIVRVAINTENVRSVSFAEDEYLTVTDFMVKMIPLRQAAEALGYIVEWNEYDRVIRVINGGFEARIEVGQNIYSLVGRVDPVELEAPPLLVDGVTHVPVSFFSEIMGASHSADEDRTVTISIYVNSL